MSCTLLKSPRGAARAFLALALLLSCVVTSRAQVPTAFTYQGRLTDAGSPATGPFDFEFKLFDGTGMQLGSVQTREDVPVTNGVFLVRLDFGSTPFVPGAPASTLEIGVRPGASTATFTTLAPRQPITATPYAVQTVNAEMLGGLPASEYVKTDDPRLTDGGPPAPGSEHYIQNTTTQQPGVSFNIGGNGLFGGQVGIGTQTPTAGVSLDVNGLTRLNPGGPGGAIQFGTPNSETGMTFSNAFSRADLRFDGNSLKLVAGPPNGPPSNFSGVAVHTSGDVTVGAADTAGKMTVVASGKPALIGYSDNRGVWGTSTGNSYGVFGESVNGLGVQGQSTNNVGVAGASTTHVGVFGSTGSSDAAKPGVLGTSTGAGGVGVRGNGARGVFGASAASGGVGVTGDTTGANSIGVFGRAPDGTGVRGESQNANGFGVYAKNHTPAGMALGVEGNATQSRDKGGLVKAMIRVNEDGTVRSCYNSQLADGGASSPPSGSTGCGFSVERVVDGSDFAKGTRVRLGFNVFDRFVSVTPTLTADVGENVGIVAEMGTNIVQVGMFFTDERENTRIYRGFTLIVF